MDTTAQPAQGTEYSIKNTTQLTFDDNLRIGAGNIWEEPYTTQDGQQLEGLTGGLWFFIRQQPELNQHVRVHPGQRLEIAGYQITVLAVDAQGIRITIAQ